MIVEAIDVGTDVPVATVGLVRTAAAVLLPVVVVVVVDHLLVLRLDDDRVDKDSEGAVREAGFAALQCLGQCSSPRACCSYYAWVVVVVVVVPLG